MISKPLPGEYKPFTIAYISKVPDGPVLETLEKLKTSTYDFFSALTAEQADYAYAEGKWTLKEVLGHMIDTERIFAYRALCFSRGDKNELPGFEQEDYVQNSNYNSRSIQSLADEFKAVRESNLYLFNSLTEAQGLMTGIASNHIFSVRAFVYMIAGHELHHLGLIKELYMR